MDFFIRAFLSSELLITEPRSQAPLPLVVNQRCSVAQPHLEREDLL